MEVIDLFTMTEKQRKGIDFVINNLKKKYSFIKGWDSVDVNKYYTLGVVCLICDDTYSETILSGEFKQEVLTLMNIYYKLLPEEYHIRYTLNPNEIRTKQLVPTFI